MARPYTFAEIGHVDTLVSDASGERLDASGAATIGLEAMRRSGVIEGALLYGSIPASTYEKGSDLDMLLISGAAPDAPTQIAVGIRRVATDLYRRFGVDVDLSVYGRAELARGQHHYRANTLHHLAQEEEAGRVLVVGVNPLDIMSAPQTDLALDADSFFLQQEQQLLHAYASGTFAYPEMLLDRILNTPHRSARKALDVLSYLGRLPDDALKGLSRAQIREAFGRYCNDQEAIQMYDNLSEDWHRYLIFNDEVRQGMVSEQEHAQILFATIDANALQAAELIRRIHSFYRFYMN